MKTSKRMKYNDRVYILINIYNMVVIMWYVIKRYFKFETHPN